MIGQTVSWVRMLCRTGLAAFVGLLLAGGWSPLAAQEAAGFTNADLPRPSMRALKAGEEIRLDGVLDEPSWRGADVASAFVQAEPREGQAATERTEVRVVFDEDNLYIGAYLYDSQPDRLVVTDIRKDFNEQTQDVFAVILDTFHDRRSGYVFMTTPEGARGDRQVANEGREINVSWDAIWSVETRRNDDGWVVEMQIPFRALRFDPSSDGTWGINFSRNLRRNNELAYWAPIPRSFTLTRLSLAGEIQGLPSASAGRDLRITPYALGGTVRETGHENFDRTTEVGIDVKYGLTDGLTLDLTANPDFAQVEADEQRVNLTQFSLFFPEKREFFLENSGVFYVGDAARNTRVALAPRPDEDLLVFFSRRIGIAPSGTPVPITAGARVTGQALGLVIGAMAMRTGDLGDKPGDDYAVVRVRKNVLNGSDIGGIVMTRQSVSDSGDFNRVYGLDSYIRFPSNIDWSTYVLKTETPGKDGGEYAWRTSLNRESNFTHVKFGAMELGEGFENDIGFFRRVGVRKYFLDTGIRPRPEWMRERGVREMHPHIVWNYYEDVDGRMRAKNLHTGYTFFMNSGAYVELSVNPKFERIDEEFRIDPDIDPIPPGSYSWNTWMVRGNTDASRALSAGFTGIVGGLWSGTQKTVTGSVTIRPSFRFRATISGQHTAAELDIPAGSFTKTFWTTRTNYSFNRNMFVDALLQYDPESTLFNANVRFNFIHHPLSDLFVVYNEQRFSTGQAIHPGRSLTIKITQMVSF